MATVGVEAIASNNEGSLVDGGSAMIDAYPNKYVSGTLPVLYINTEGGVPITSKEIYINATYFIDNMGIEKFEAVGSYEGQLPMEIRGRGHSSWKGETKPYKLKLGQKTRLFGMSKSIHWALLKPTENTIAGLQLGKIMNMDWTPSMQPIEVVLNDDYIGLYFLTETIRIEGDRVNIYEQPDGETDPDLIPGGWLVEIDNYYDSNQIIVNEHNMWNMNVRYHSPEVLSSLQKQWLTDEFNAIVDAVYASDKRSTAWECYIDVDAMARFFIVQEVMDNPDGFHGSFYLHKDLGEGAKWEAGPIWDLACYNREKTDYTFKMKVHYGITPHLIGEIIQYDSFCQAVRRVWEEVYPDKISSILQYIDDNVLPLECAWSADCKRWGDDTSQTAHLRATRLKNAIEGNIRWFNAHLPVSKYSGIEFPSIDSQPFTVYNLQGMAVGQFFSIDEATMQLPDGFYISKGKKIIVR